MSFFDYNITSNYGTRVHPITNVTQNHDGIDFGLPYNTEVKSNVSGVVSNVGYQASGFGNYVIVKDSSGRLHTYAHLTKANVSTGDTISVNDVLGTSGSTGLSTGPHLHYQVNDADGTVLNPATFTSLSLTEGSNTEENNYTNTGFSIKDKLKNIVFQVFKFIIIALLVVLCIVFITKSLDIEIL